MDDPKKRSYINAMDLEGAGGATPGFAHFVITRFSYRGPFWTDDDPLDPARLERRFECFESITLPSLLAQTNLDFEYLVLVDKDLPDSLRRRLLDLLAPLSRWQVIDYSPDLGIDTTGWLADLNRETAGSWVLTTNLDDDDALSPTFLDSLRNAARNHVVRDRPLWVFGAADVSEWTAIATPQRPLGSFGPWRRGDPATAGYSMLSNRDRCDITVFGLSHSYVGYLNTGTISAAIPRQQLAMERLLDIHGADVWEPGFYVAVPHSGPSVLMVNHLDNVQATRHGKPDQLAPATAADLGFFGVAEAAAHRIAKRHELRVRGLGRLVGRIYRHRLPRDRRPTMGERLSVLRAAVRSGIATFLVNRRL